MCFLVPFQVGLYYYKDAFIVIMYQTHRLPISDASVAYIGRIGCLYRAHLLRMLTNAQKCATIIMSAVMQEQFFE